MGYLSRGARAHRTRSVGTSVPLWAALVALLASASVAYAQPVALRWDAPRSCPEAREVLAHVQELVGPEDQASAAPVKARVRIVRNAARYQLSLTLDTDAHHAARTLHARTCAELIDAVAWLIALAINPEIERADLVAPPAAGVDSTAAAGTERPGATAPQGANARGDETRNGASQATNGSASKAEASPGERKPQSQPSTEQTPRAEVREVSGAAQEEAPLRKAPSPPLPRGYALGAAAGIATGAGVDVQAAVGAFAGLSVGWSYSQLRFSGLLPRELDIAPGARARLWSLELDVAQCALWGRSVRGGPCVTLGGLRTTADVEGLRRESDKSGFWGVAGAGFSMFFRLPRRLQLALGVGATLPVSKRPRFMVEGIGAVASARPWSLDARLGLAFAGP